MRFMKNYLSSMLVTIAAILILVAAALAIDVQKMEPEIDVVDLFEAQENAVAAHNLLYGSFLEAGGPEAVFPENYGGDFIDGDMLHVCIAFRGGSTCYLP